MKGFYVNEEGFLYLPLLLDYQAAQELKEGALDTRLQDQLIELEGDTYVQAMYLPDYLADKNTINPNTYLKLQQDVLASTNAFHHNKNKTERTLQTILTHALPQYTQCPFPQPNDETFKGVSTLILDYCLENFKIPPSVFAKASTQTGQNQKELEEKIQHLKEQRVTTIYKNRLAQSDLGYLLNKLRKDTIITQEIEATEKQIELASQQAHNHERNKQYNAIFDYLASDGAQFKENRFFLKTKKEPSGHFFRVGLKTGDFALEDGGDGHLYLFKSLDLGVELDATQGTMHQIPTPQGYQHPILHGDGFCFHGRTFYKQLTGEGLVKNLELLYEVVLLGSYRGFGSLFKRISKTDPRIQDKTILITNKAGIQATKNGEEKLDNYGL